MGAANIPGDPEKTWGPVVDGRELQDYPDVLFRKGKTHTVPVLCGTNTNEGTCFVYPGFPHGMNQSAYRGFLLDTLTTGDRALTAADVEKVLQKYPPIAGQDMRALASDLFTDLFLCRDRNAVASLSSRTQTFMYRFDHRPTCPQPMPSAPGTYHGLELPFVFGTAESYQCKFSGPERKLSERMQTMWTNFAKTLSPSLASEHFPRYSKGSPQGLVLKIGADGIDHGYRSSFCDLWDDIWEA